MPAKGKDGLTPPPPPPSTPLALRHEELTGQEFESLYRNVKDHGSTKGRLVRKPRPVPIVPNEAASS